MTLAVAALAVAAIFMSSSASLLSRFYDRDRLFAYAAESALEQVVARFQMDDDFTVTSTTPTSVPDLTAPTDADGNVISGVNVVVWAARTGDISSSGPITISLLAQVSDANGTRRVRRLDLRRDTFAQIDFFSNDDVSSSRRPFAEYSKVVARVFTNGDWATITGATFKDTVSGVGTVEAGSGAFLAGSEEGVREIPWPDDDDVLDGLQAIAAAQGLEFPENGSNDDMRLEFVWIDLDSDGVADRDEGHLRIFDLRHSEVERLAAQPGTGTFHSWNSEIIQNQCGAFYYRGSSWQFFPVATHRTTWAQNVLATAGTPAAPSPSSWTNNANRRAATIAILSQSTARCFPAGSPYLVNTERFTDAAGAVGTSASLHTIPYGVVDPSHRHGGAATTITEVSRTCSFSTNSSTGGEACSGNTSALGTWRTLSAVSGRELYAQLDGSGAGAVVSVDDDAWISGTIAGRVTLAVDDETYFVDRVELAGGASTEESECAHVFGVVSRDYVYISDSPIFHRSRVGSNATNAVYVSLGGADRAQFFGAFMSLRQSFSPEDNAGIMGVETSQYLCDGKRFAMGCVSHIGSVAMDVSREFSNIESGDGGRYQLTPDACFERGYRPPHYPETNRYRRVRAIDVQPKSIIGLNAIPNYFASLQGISEIP